MNNQRQYYRVQYPITERPLLFLPSGCVAVMDVSEFGVRIALSSGSDLEPGMYLTARIRFHDGFEQVFHGEILRRDDDSMSIYLHQPIPLKRIHAESVYLHHAYQLRFDLAVSG